MNESYFWPIVILLGLGTQSIRASFVFLFEKVKLPKTFEKGFPYIPVAVLPALIAPQIFYHQGTVDGLFGYERLLASLIALIICFKTKNVLLTILSGLLSLFLINHFLT